MTAGLFGTICWDRERPVVSPVGERAPAASQRLRKDGAEWGAWECPVLPVSLAEDLEGRLWAGFAGTLRNAGPLAELLAARGHPLGGWQRADLILAAFREWGPRLVEHLDGAYAGAVFDRRARTLLLFRDPLGRVPMFYRWTPERCDFGTSLRALLEARVPRVLEPRAARSYFERGFISGPETGIRTAHRVAAGAWVWSDRQGVRAHDAQPATFSEPSSESEEILLDRLEDRLQRAAEAEPVDACWLEPTVAAQLLVALSRAPATVGASTDAVSRMANLLGTRHDRLDPPETGPDDLSWMSVPVADPRLPSWLGLAARLGKGRVAVAEGSRAVFAADPSLAARLAQEAATGLLPRSMRTRLERMLPDRAALGTDTAGAWACLHPDLRRLSPWPLNPGHGPDRLSDLQEMSLRNEHADGSFQLLFDLSLRFDLRVSLPYCDPEVVSVARCLPASARVEGRRSGTGLGQIAHRRLPGRVQPEAPASDPWGELWKGPWREWAESLLFDRPGGASGLLDTRAVRRTWYEHQLGIRDHGRRLRTVILFEGWARTAFEGSRV